MENRKARIGFGVGNLLIAVFVLFGVFRLLPTRWWVVDAGAIIVALALAVAGGALLRQATFARELARIASLVVLALGMALVSAIAIAASAISGIYGAVGATGAVLFSLVLLLVLPYVVVFPAVQLMWIGRRKS